MATDYEKIGEENRRKYGTETAHLRIITGIYARRTHFLYELLQNAEDAGASRVAIDLHADRLEFRHDGRIFDERDVRGVCGVCVGTKASDLTKIGKFGIGFKSVYAYTKSPEIHSGDEHFRIDAYTQPIRVPPRMDLSKPWTTLQVFPFDSSERKPEEAVKEIGQAFRKLGMRTLVFLRKIDEVRWLVAGGDSGIIRRNTRTKSDGASRQVQVIEDSDGQSGDEEWLIFRRSVQVPPDLAGDAPGKASVDVELAYRLTRGDENVWSICRSQETELVVFFPTQRETHLGFLIQGPYRTTPARDNIREDDEWNRLLIEETAALVGDSLRELRRRRLLTIEVLKAMPINPHDFPEDGVFRAIYDRVREILAGEPLIPSAKGKFIAGDHAKICSTPDLRKLLSPNILRQLFRSDEPLGWIEGDLSENLRDYLTGVLHIEIMTPDTFASRFDEAFIARRTDAWVARFYAFLDGRRKLWDKGKIFYTPPLRNKSFIRLRDRSHVPPFDDEGYPLAWLPGPLQFDESPVVKAEILRGNKRAISFLKNLGLSEPDVVDEVLSRVLPRYAQPPVRVSPRQHARDLELINQALKTDSGAKRHRLEDSLQETPFLWAVNKVTGRRKFRRPGEVYEPKAEQLLHYFEGNRNAWFLDDDLPDEADIYFAEAVLDEVGIDRREASPSGYVLLDAENGLHRRGVAGFDPDCHVFGLEDALKSITSEKAAYIWGRILIPLAGQISGKVEYSSSAYFRESERPDVHSRMGKLVTDNAWLPSRSDREKFHRPGELTLEDLPEGFEPNRALASALGMTPSGIVQLAEKISIDVECLDLFLEQVQKNRDQVVTFLNSLKELPPAPKIERDGDGGRIKGPGVTPGTSEPPASDWQPSRGGEPYTGPMKYSPPKASNDRLVRHLGEMPRRREVDEYREGPPDSLDAPVGPLPPDEDPRPGRIRAILYAINIEYGFLRFVRDDFRIFGPKYPSCIELVADDDQDRVKVDVDYDRGIVHGGKRLTEFLESQAWPYGTILYLDAMGNPDRFHLHALPLEEPSPIEPVVYFDLDEQGQPVTRTSYPQPFTFRVDENVYRQERRWENRRAYDALVAKKGEGVLMAVFKALETASGPMSAAAVHRQLMANGRPCSYFSVLGVLYAYECFAVTDDHHWTLAETRPSLLREGYRALLGAEDGGPQQPNPAGGEPTTPLTAEDLNRLKRDLGVLTRPNPEQWTHAIDRLIGELEQIRHRLIATPLSGDVNGDGPPAAMDRTPAIRAR